VRRREKGQLHRAAPIKETSKSPEGGDPTLRGQQKKGEKKAIDWGHPTCKGISFREKISGDEGVKGRKKFKERCLKTFCPHKKGFSNVT